MPSSVRPSLRLLRLLSAVAVLAAGPVAVCECSGSAFAQQAAAPDLSSPAVRPVAALNAGLLEVMKAGKSTPFATRLQMLTPVVKSSFDLDLILRNSVGPRYAAFPGAQRQQLLDTFTQFTVASYVANFDELGDTHFEILPNLRPSGADTVVPTRILNGAVEAAKIDYVVQQEAAGPQITDVLLDGTISRVAVQRSDFRSLVASGDAAPLIAMLRRKVESFASGARQ